MRSLAALGRLHVVAALLALRRKLLPRSVVSGLLLPLALRRMATLAAWRAVLVETLLALSAAWVALGPVGTLLATGLALRGHRLTLLAAAG